MTPIDDSKRDALKLLGAGTALSVLGAGTATAEGRGGPVLDSKRMAGNDLTGSAGAIRGVDAGGLPWVVDDARARLKADGELDVRVEGLIIDPDADHAAAGTNPVPQFRAIVSCLSPDGSGHVVETVRTETFTASEAGDARIEAELDVPDPCLAPIVLVAGPEEILGSDVWFAVTSA